MRYPFAVLSVVMVSAVVVQAEEPGGKGVVARAADADAPLAKDFPGATKPGEVEVKRYPAYRGAVATAAKVSAGAGDMLFWPLFNHISKNEIAMTAPVINTYKSAGVIGDPEAKGEMSMEFVYRTPDQGKPGRVGPLVTVEDHPAADYVCLGLQGGMSETAMRDGVARLRAWLEEHKGEWVEDGPPRRLGYHGPMTPAPERLWEVQLPVKKADGAPKG